MNALYRLKREMLRRMRNPDKIKVIRYAYCMNELNEYSYAFLGLKVSDNIGEMVLNEIILNRMPNVRTKRAYVQVVDCKSVA